MLIKWCLNLRLASRKANDVIKQTGVLKLPNDKTLRSFIHWKDHTTGFSTDTLQQLLHQFKPHDREEFQKHVIIIHDEMKVKAYLVYDKTTGQLVGFRDLDNFTNKLNDLEASLQEEVEPQKQLAKYVLVFQVMRAIFWNFNYSLAHIATTSNRRFEIFHLFGRAIEILELAGLKVVGVTCDGASTNRKFLDIHGPLNVTKPVFKVPNPFAPEDEQREVFLLNDAPHRIKCVRNAFASKKRMLWVSSSKIEVAKSCYLVHHTVNEIIK